MLYQTRYVIADAIATQERVIQLGGESHGNYRFTDHIFAPSLSANIKRHVLRIRQYDRSDSSLIGSKYLVTEKTVEWSIASKTEKVLNTNNFCTLLDAIRYIENRYPKHQLLFTFNRLGWHYSLVGNDIFIEDMVETGPSMEIHTEHIKMLTILAAALKAGEQWTDSVPSAIQKIILQKKNIVVAE